MRHLAPQAALWSSRRALLLPHSISCPPGTAGRWRQHHSEFKFLTHLPYKRFQSAEPVVAVVITGSPRIPEGKRERMNFFANLKQEAMAGLEKLHDQHASGGFTKPGTNPSPQNLEQGTRATTSSRCALRTERTQQEKAGNEASCAFLLGAEAASAHWRPHRRPTVHSTEGPMGLGLPSHHWRQQTCLVC